ncbi:hypothetical protein OEZ86_012942 [Tetradesmus obliquus]|nr:hypothetical protein OEZ86_012942 [Tetradesmus obliquus]
MQVEVGSQLSERSPPRHDAGSSSAASASAMLQQPVEGLRRLAQLNVEVKQSQPTGVGAGALLCALLHKRLAGAYMPVVIGP